MTDKKFNENNIETFLHCKLCYEELNNAKTKEDYSLIGAAVDGESHESYSRFEVGWTKQGFQVWCTRHNTNVIHIDFDGQQLEVDTTMVPVEN